MVASHRYHRVHTTTTAAAAAQCGNTVQQHPVAGWHVAAQQREFSIAPAHRNNLQPQAPAPNSSMESWIHCVSQVLPALCCCAAPGVLLTRWQLPVQWRPAGRQHPLLGHTRNRAGVCACVHVSGSVRCAWITLSELVAPCLGVLVGAACMLFCLSCAQRCSPPPCCAAGVPCVRWCAACSGRQAPPTSG